MENCGSFKSFGFIYIYIYIYRLVFYLFIIFKSNLLRLVLSFKPKLAPFSQTRYSTPLHYQLLHLYRRHSSLTHDSFSPSLTLSSTLLQPSPLTTLHLLAPLITRLIVVNTTGSSQVLFLNQRYQLCPPISQPICFFFTPRYGF